MNPKLALFILTKKFPHPTLIDSNPLYPTKSTHLSCPTPISFSIYSLGLGQPVLLTQMDYTSLLHSLGKHVVWNDFA